MRNTIKLTLLLLVSFLAPLLVFAGGKIQMSFEFATKDAYTGQKTEGISIGIYTAQGELILEGESLSSGLYAPKIELDPTQYEVRISDKQDRYLAYNYTFTVSKKWSTHRMVIILYPSARILASWIVEEDKLYGTVKTGSLAPELNTDSLIFGCRTDQISEAQFPEGISAMQKYIAQHVEYPQISIEENEQGRVYAKFVVEKDGSISHVEIERGAAPLLDAETIRVIRQMPKWIQANCGEEALRTLIRMPIVFRLE